MDFFSYLKYSRAYIQNDLLRQIWNMPDALA